MTRTFARGKVSLTGRGGIVWKGIRGRRETRFKIVMTTRLVEIE